jgi:hypothetical protein
MSSGGKTHECHAPKPDTLGFDLARARLGALSVTEPGDVTCDKKMVTGCDYLASSQPNCTFIN